MPVTLQGELQRVRNDHDFATKDAVKGEEALHETYATLVEEKRRRQQAEEKLDIIMTQIRKLGGDEIVQRLLTVSSELILELWFSRSAGARLLCCHLTSGKQMHADSKKMRGQRPLRGTRSTKGTVHLSARLTLLWLFRY